MQVKWKGRGGRDERQALRVSPAKGEKRKGTPGVRKTAPQKRRLEHVMVEQTPEVTAQPNSPSTPEETLRASSWRPG